MTPVGRESTTVRDAGGVDVVLYTPAWRTASGVLKVVARGSLLVTAGLFLFSEHPPTNPLRQMRLFGAFFVVPEVLAWCIARAFAAKMSVADGALILEQKSRRTEIPTSAIVGVEPWPVPLPRAGVDLRLKSGRRFAHGVAVRDCGALVEALVAEGASGDLRDGLARPVAAYTQARLASPAGFFEHPLLKFVLYSLVPALPAFRLHQFITYGGTFGEYYTFGLQAYLIGLGLWWVSWAIGLVVLAAVMRAAIEIVAMLAALVVPAYAGGVRRVLEWSQRILYYVGIPVWLALRFLA